MTSCPNDRDCGKANDVSDPAGTLSRIDDYYADQHGAGDGVASQLVRQLAEPVPKGRSTTRNLRQYKNLAARWQEWEEVVSVCRRLAASIVEGVG